MCIRFPFGTTVSRFPLDNGTFSRKADKADRRNRQLVREASVLEAATAPEACSVFLPAAADFLGVLSSAPFSAYRQPLSWQKPYCPFREQALGW